MEVLRSIWLFIQDQVLGMKWLNAVIGNGLSAVGLDTSTRWGGSIQFFIYVVIKITVLLCFLIFMISYIQSTFPPEQENPEEISRDWGKYYRSPAWHGNAVLFLLVNSAVHWIYERRPAAWRDIFLFDFLSDG